MRGAQNDQFVTHVTKTVGLFTNMVRQNAQAFEELGR
jgi:hypothetical protein